MKTVLLLCLLATLAWTAIGSPDDAEGQTTQDRELNECKPHYEVVAVGLERFCLKPWITEKYCYDDGTEFATSLSSGLTYCIDHTSNPTTKYGSLPAKQSSYAGGQDVITGNTVDPASLTDNRMDDNSVRNDNLKVGQWVKYRPSVSFGGDGSLEKVAESTADLLKKQIQESSGFDIDSAVWVKYTVSDISGTIVTFDRSVKLASDPETKDEFLSQSFEETLELRDGIDEDILSKISERKLEPRQFDLSEFHPASFFVMPTNLEFGSKFEGGSLIGDIIFSSISDDISYERKVNVFSANKIFTEDIRQGVVENTIEYDVFAHYHFDRHTGVLLDRSMYIDVLNLNTYELVWIVYEISSLDDSGILKSPDVDRSINDKNEILERLSYFFVESANSEFLFTNGVDSIGTPKRTTFDIIRVSDGYELGALILYGDEKISSIRTSTLVGGDVKPLQSDRIHGIVLQSLDLGCEILVPDHFDLYLKNVDKGSVVTETVCDDFTVIQSWVETDEFFGLGMFVQEIVFDKNAKLSQENALAEQNEQIFDENGGCLIATAAFGSELAPQVQQLREVRDNYLLQTNLGSDFMNSFNYFYYFFSPTVADYMRETPVFKETVKAGVTPLITSLLILNHVDITSEMEVFGYGIILIILNIGMYVGIPASAILLVRKSKTSRRSLGTIFDMLSSIRSSRRDSCRFNTVGSTQQNQLPKQQH